MEKHWPDSDDTGQEDERRESHRREEQAFLLSDADAKVEENDADAVYAVKDDGDEKKEVQCEVQGTMQVLHHGIERVGTPQDRGQDGNVGHQVEDQCKSGDSMQEPGVHACSDVGRPENAAPPDHPRRTALFEHEKTTSLDASLMMQCQSGL